VVLPGTVVPGGSRNQASDMVIDHSPTSPSSFAISVLRIVFSDSPTSAMQAWRRSHGLDKTATKRRSVRKPYYFVRVAVADLTAYEIFHSSRVMTIPGIGRMHSRFAI
jgi:hypothetical protein